MKYLRKNLLEIIKKKRSDGFLDVTEDKAEQDCGHWCQAHLVEVCDVVWDLDKSGLTLRNCKVGLDFKPSLQKFLGVSSWERVSISVDLVLILSWSWNGWEKSLATERPGASMVR